MGAGAEISVSEATAFLAWIESNPDVIDLYPGRTEHGDARHRLNNEMTSKSERIHLSDTLGSLGSDPPKLQI